MKRTQRPVYKNENMLIIARTVRFYTRKKLFSSNYKNPRFILPARCCFVKNSIAEPRGIRGMLFSGIFLNGIGGYPPPTLNGKSFCPKILTGIGGCPPPLTEKSAQ